MGQKKSLVDDNDDIKYVESAANSPSKKSPTPEINEAKYDNNRSHTVNTIDLICNLNGTERILLKPTVEDTIEDLVNLLRDEIHLPDDNKIYLSMMSTGKPLQHYRKIIDYNLNDRSYIQAKIIPIDTNNKGLKKVDCYNYCQVLLITEHWCHLFGIKQIEKILLDYIAIYSCFAAPAILFVDGIEEKRFHFRIGLKLNGCSAYFMRNNDEIVDKYWLNQYMELKLAEINIESDSVKQLLNVTKLAYDAKQEDSDNYKDEIFTLNTSFPNNYIEIYKIKGKLDGIVCWVEFEFVNFLKEKNDIKTFKLPSEHFKFAYHPLKGVTMSEN